MNEALLKRVQTALALAVLDCNRDMSALLDDVTRALSLTPSALVGWLNPKAASASQAFAWPCSVHKPDSVYSVALYRMPAQLYLVGQCRGASWEFQGVFSAPEDADAACKTRAFFVYPITLDEELPVETTMPQPDSVRWPRCNGGQPLEVFAQAWASRDVLAERQRQIDAEGWTAEHDDEHSDGSMAIAAAAYALAGHPAVPDRSIEQLWDAARWDPAWLKVRDRRHNLARAAALLLAEIERLDRAADREAGHAGDLNHLHHHP